MPLRADYYAEQPRASRGLIVLVHGYCEHRGRYRHVAEHLAAQGYAVFCGDLRGHGESGGERGFVHRFGEYLDDVTAFLSEAESLYDENVSRGSQGGSAPAVRGGEPLRPLLVAHSLGGLIALQYVLAYPTAVRAIALSSPFLGIKVKVPVWKRGLGLVASLAHPTLRLPNGLDAADVSHDPEVVTAYATDPLVTHEATARWFTETTAAQSDSRMRANRVRLPTLFLTAGDDRIVDSEVSQNVFARIGASDKMLNVYPGLFHEIFNELQPDRQRVLSDLSSWLNDR
jgi:alpha-beta hydrolase superfamily lysophospholipase